jgi:hypothetical protein
VLFEGILKNIQSKLAVQIQEKGLAQVIAFGNDNGIFARKIV